MLNATEEYIDKEIDHDLKIVLFYADWCPFCKKFIPLFELYEKNNNIPFVGVKINDDENPLWDRFQINAIPTVIAFKDGKIIDRLGAVPHIGLKEEAFKLFINTLEKSI